MALKSSKILNIFMWIVQFMLAFNFLWTGFIKMFQPEKLPFTWTKDNPNLVFLTSIVDLLGGLGIILPTMFNIKSRMTVFAAYGIIVLMIAAGIFHILRGEINDIGFNIFVILITAFIAWGRSK
jgi:uncharacterized membrane protein